MSEMRKRWNGGITGSREDLKVGGSCFHCGRRIAAGVVRIQSNATQNVSCSLLSMVFSIFLSALQAVTVLVTMVIWSLCFISRLLFSRKCQI